jgi:hypothetical protein
MVCVSSVRRASSIRALCSVVLDVPVYAQLAQHALMMVHDCHHRTRIYLNHTLKVVGLDILRAQDESVTSFLMEKS